MNEMSRDDFLKIIYVPNDFNIFTDIEKEYIIFNLLDNFNINKKNKFNGLFSNVKYSISTEQEKHKKMCKSYIENGNYIEAYYELVYYFQCYNNNYNRNVIYLNELLEINNLINDYKFNLYNNIYNKINVEELIDKFSTSSNIYLYVEDLLSINKSSVEKAIIFENDVIKVKMNKDIYEFSNESSIDEFKSIIVKNFKDLYFFSYNQEKSNNPEYHKKMINNGYYDYFSGNINGLSFNINNNCQNKELVKFGKCFRREIWKYINKLKDKLLNQDENNKIKEIINDICLKLTDDFKYNYNYLNSSIDKYIDDPLYDKIKISINNKIFQLLLNNSKDKRNDINDIIYQVQDEIFSENPVYEKNIQVLMNLVNDNIFYEYYNFYELHDFRDDIDYYFYQSIDRNIKRIYIPFSKIYYLLAIIYNNQNKYEEALKMAEKAIKWNPLFIDAYFEMFYSYKKQNDIDNLKNLINKIHTYIYKPDDLAYFYKTIGDYYYDLNDLELAYAIYYISYKNKNNRRVLERLANINELLGRGNYLYKDEELKEILEKNGIPYGTSEENINRIIDIYINNKQIIKKPLIDAEIARMIYLYTGDKNFSPLIHLIDSKTGIEMLYPRSFKYVKGKNIHSFYNDRNDYIQIAFERQCTKDQYNSICSDVIDKTINNNEINCKLLRELNFDSDYLVPGTAYRAAIFESNIDNEIKKVLTIFIIIKNYFVICSIDIDDNLDYNDSNNIYRDYNFNDLLDIIHYMVDLNENK